MTQPSTSLLSRAKTRYQRDGLRGVSRSLAYRLRRPFGRLRWGLRKRWSKATGARRVHSAYGVDLAPNWDDVTFRLYVTGAYGMTLADLLAAQRQPFIFLDIGANQGLYSLLAVKNPNCLQAIALEPVADTFALLQANIELNNAGERVLPLPWAISDRAGSAQIARKARHSGVASLERAANLGTAGEETIALHEFHELGAHLVDEHCPIFVKIDVEGHEPAVVRSMAAAAALHPRINNVFYEVDERWVDVSSLQKNLHELGFLEFKDIGSGVHRDILATRESNSGRSTS